jgi:methyl-accepting chemotaxis protein
MFGYGPDEVLEVNHQEFCPTETVDSDCYAQLWIHLRAGVVRRIKEQRVTRGGREVWLDTTYVPIRDHRGAVRSVIEFARDITAEATRFDALRKTLTAAKTVLGLVEFDTAGMMRDFNDGFLRMVGYPARSLQDQHHSILCSTDESTSPGYRDFWQALSSGETRTGQFTLLGHLGREIVVIGSYLPVRNMGGGIGGVLFLAIEVTTFTAVRKPTLAPIDIKGIGTGPADEMTPLDALELAIADTQDFGVDGKPGAAGRLAEVEGVERTIRSIRETVNLVNEIAADASRDTVSSAVGGQDEADSILAGEARRMAEQDAGKARDIMAQVRAITDRIAREMNGSPVAVAAMDASARHLTDAVSRVQSLVTASAAQAEKVNQTAEVLRDLSEGVKA